ncbi:MAG: MFS transporter [Candidatus Omnitrophota bacterium]|nr:MFS transporter [Patescibacteria group bacterium]
MSIRKGQSVGQAASQPKHHVTAQKDRVPLFQKTVYSIGAFANTSQAAFIGQMVIVLNLGLGVNPALVGLVGAIPRIVDAVSDPVTGYFSDNLRTRWGRRKPVIFFGAIAGGIFYALMFQLHKGHGEFFYFWYFLIFQVLYFIGFTCFSIPWIALGYEMTPDYHERTRLQAASNFVGQLPWLIAPWCWAIMHNRGWFPDIVHGGRVLAIIIGVVIIGCGILPAIFNKEYFHTLPKPDVRGAWNVTKDFFGGTLITLRSKPFVKLCLATLLIFGGFMCASAFTLYVVFFYVFKNAPVLDQAYAKGGVLLGFYGTFSAVCTLGVIFLTVWLSRKLGKRNTFFVTIPLSILGYALKWIGYNPNHPYLLFIAAPFITFGLGSLFTLMSSMVADVCDVDELQTSTRREGMFSAVYWWMVKLGVALSSLISGFLINSTGFRQELGLAQAPGTLLWLRIYDVGIPIVTSVAAIFIIWTFDISEARAHEVRVQIERRREERRAAERLVEEERRKAERRKE